MRKMQGRIANIKISFISQAKSHGDSPLNWGLFYTEWLNPVKTDNHYFDIFQSILF